MTLSIINLLSFQSTPRQTCGISSLVDCLSESNHPTNDWCGNYCNQNHNGEWKRYESRTTWCQFSINNTKLGKEISIKTFLITIMFSINGSLQTPYNI